MATQPIPIYSQNETFYVPRFEVYVGGKNCRPDIINDILQVTYKDSINEIDSFTIEVNNWDADQRKFKFAPPRKEYEGVFDPGKKIEIRMGYYKNMRRMMRGVITDLEPNFPESGASTLNVHGLNELHKYRDGTAHRLLDRRTKNRHGHRQGLVQASVEEGPDGPGLDIDAIRANETADKLFS